MSAISKQISDDAAASHTVADSPERAVGRNGGLPEGRVKAIVSSSNGAATPTARKTLKLSTVSHTLDAEIAERLRHFAFRERISESAVIEFSLRTFFSGGDDAALGSHLRENGAGLRRKS